MKAPFPWFGGKRRVAAEVWAALGDVGNYIEPFAGSLAVLLERPAWHTGFVETVNDADQYIANFWRALAADPDAVAHHADWPVNETDLFARHLWLVNAGKERMIAGMEADPEWYDAKIAGRWVWGQCAWIGSGWCFGNGPHDYASLTVDGNAGRGVNRQRPHLGAGIGVNRKLPHLSDAGNGVARKLPHLSDAGNGVNRKRPHQSLYEYMSQLAQRLHRVRVCCGDWSRVVTKGAMSYGSTVGVFLDPPYADTADRWTNLYVIDCQQVAHEVCAWAIANGDNPRLRIVLAGYEGEHDIPDTWTTHAWKAGATYQSCSGTGKNSDNRKRERLWYSPHCLKPQPALFERMP